MKEQYKTSFVIATYNRSKYFIEAYKYFVTQKDSHLINVIVVDGTTDKEAAKTIREFCEAHSNFDYEHVAFSEEDKEMNTSLYKMLLGIRKVKTPTVKICDDEDIHSVEAVLVCADFLEKNDDYAIADGYWYWGQIDDHKFTASDAYGRVGIEQSQPLARLWDSLLFWKKQTVLSLYKTPILAEFFEKIDANLMQHYFYVPEFGINSIGLLSGKFKKLDINFGVRIKNPHNSRVSESDISRFFGPYKQSVDYSKIPIGLKSAPKFKLHDEIDALRSALLDYIDPTDENYDTLTIILSCLYASLILQDAANINNYSDKNLDLTLLNDVLKLGFELGTPGFYGNERIYYNYALNDNRLKGNIAIYGAGQIGKYVHEQIKNKHQVNCFVDKNAAEIKEYCGLPVIAPESIATREIDCIIIATIRDGLEDEMLETLVSLGIDEKKIHKISSFAKKYTYEDYHRLAFETD